MQMYRIRPNAHGTLPCAPRCIELHPSRSLVSSFNMYVQGCFHPRSPYKPMKAPQLMPLVIREKESPPSPLRPGVVTRGVAPLVVPNRVRVKSRKLRCLLVAVALVSLFFL